MTASVLSEAAGAEAEAYAAKPARTRAHDAPRRSTRDLEAVFAQPDGRWRMAGLGLALTVSGAFWIALAVLAF